MIQEPVGPTNKLSFKMKHQTTAGIKKTSDLQVQKVQI